MKNKKIKNDIRNEINLKNKELLSLFSDEEIEQINFSFNQMELGERENLIYHKVIHNIKNAKDYIKYYAVVFRPFIFLIQVEIEKTVLVVLMSLLLSENLK